jgi:hypothetical protein
MKILRDTAQWCKTRQVFTEPNKRDPLTLDVIDLRTGTRLAEEVLRVRIHQVLRENGWQVKE